MRVRTEAKRAAIVSAAQAVFIESGFERASMAEIAARAAASKVTLYGYFPSKEALFVEATVEHRRPQFEPAFVALEQESGADLRGALLRFGEALLRLTCRRDFVAARRTVIAASAHSEVGRLYYDVGPKCGEERVGAFMKKQMSAGRLRRGDPRLLVRHLLALLESETMYANLLGVRRSTSRAVRRRVAERAVDAFLRAYARPAAPAASGRTKARSNGDGKAATRPVDGDKAAARPLDSR
jgi:AcrR family transcriptional regulator